MFWILFMCDVWQYRNNMVNHGSKTIIKVIYADSYRQTFYSKYFYHLTKSLNLNIRMIWQMMVVYHDILLKQDT